MRGTECAMHGLKKNDSYVYVLLQVSNKIGIYSYS